MKTATVRVQLADAPQVRDTIERANATIQRLQDALVDERLGWSLGAGLMDDDLYLKTRYEVREQLRAEGLPMGKPEATR